MRKIILRLIIFTCCLGMDESHSLRKLKDWFSGKMEKTETQTASKNVKNANNTITKCQKSNQDLSTAVDKALQKLINKNLWSIGDLSPMVILRILCKNLSILFELLSLYMNGIKKALDEYNKAAKNSKSKSSRKQKKGSTQMSSAQTNLGIVLRFFSSTQLNLMDAIIRADLSFLVQMMEARVAVAYVEPFRSKISKIVTQINSVCLSLESGLNDMIEARNASGNDEAFSEADYRRCIENLMLYKEIVNIFLSYINHQALKHGEGQALLRELVLSGQRLNYTDGYEYEEPYYDDRDDYNRNYREENYYDD